MTKLEEAERLLREDQFDMEGLTSEERKALLDELERLRAEVAALNGESSQTVYTWWHEPEGAVDQMLLGFWEKDVNAARGSRPDDTCDRPFAIRLSATEVKP